MIKITECPRDAMQGFQSWIPTKKKIEYLQLLQKVGFDTLDAGSFVSPKVIPQMADSEEVFTHLNNENSKLLAIVLNEKGMEKAILFPEIQYIGFPLSVSETFQLRNSNKTITESVEILKSIKNLADNSHKELRVYLSMGFGNPYQDAYNEDILRKNIELLLEMGIENIVPSDTLGNANPKLIREVYSKLNKNFPTISFGCHLHARIHEAESKIEAAYESGVRDFDSAMLGFGGCPLADDHLVGNIPTELLVDFFAKKEVDLGLNKSYFEQAKKLAQEIFN